MYTYGLQQKYADVFKQSGKTFQFPLTFNAPVEICEQYAYHVDMTWFPNDGGGTQYVQLEAMDAGTANIMHEDWFRYKDVFRKHVQVFVVDGSEELAELLRNPDEDRRKEIVRQGYEILDTHSPKFIGKQYLEEMLK
jgi:hypothetical protein